MTMRQIIANLASLIIYDTYCLACHVTMTMRHVIANVAIDLDVSANLLPTLPNILHDSAHYCQTLPLTLMI
jgi:hypothetical protein